MTRCTDCSEWELCMECLRDLGQFDEDYKAFDDVTDKPPEMKAVMDSFFGIAPGYCSHVLDDPVDRELPGLIEKLRHLEE